MIPQKIFSYDSVELSADGRELIILDQNMLPTREVFVHLTTARELFFAITLLKVRGAPAICVAVALGLAMCINRAEVDSIDDLEAEFQQIKKYLYISRPTAVNLTWTLDRMERRFYQLKEQFSMESESVVLIKDGLLKEARAIKEEDIAKCIAIGENGLKLLHPGIRIMTYCNAGHLAVSRYGSALSPIYFAKQQGYEPQVYVCETRPMLQGSRLTAYELTKAGVDATLICDNMASTVMSRGLVDVVMLGCDRVAANGDVANKVGTSSLAILARHYGIPFYALCPTSTIDIACPTGAGIVIEERPSYEVTDTYFSSPMAPKGIKVFNPAFDVTPAELITGIVTEKGVFSPCDAARGPFQQ